MKSVIVQPHITEKAGVLAESANTYTFEVSPMATKATIAKEIEALYKVVPVKINIVRTPAKKIIARGKRGVKSGMKKAYVFLKKGDKIEFV
jgi:large subunit ribosomal protein L23